jgi:hypothetical protein
MMPETIQLIISGATLIGLVVGFYKYFRDPDVKAQQEIALLKSACKFRHKAIDENLVLIKENHLRHIEADISELKNSTTRILTILEEREKRG